MPCTKYLDAIAERARNLAKSVLGQMPDTKAGRKLGVPRGVIGGMRRLLGIPPYKRDEADLTYHGRYKRKQRAKKRAEQSDEV